MQYGISISNHCFETLYAVVLASMEPENPKECPIYALTTGQKINIPKTLVDLNDHIILLGIKKKVS